MRNGEPEGWKNLLKLQSQNENPMILDYQLSSVSIHYIALPPPHTHTHIFLFIGWKQKTVEAYFI